MNLLGSLSNDIDQLRTCKRCHRIFPVLSDLFNHICDDENDLLSSKFDKNNISLIDQISSTSPKSFKLNRQSQKLISPTNSQSSLEPEHIPLYKRPLYQHNDKQQQHSSSTYINLRNPSIHVNS